MDIEQIIDRIAMPDADGETWLQTSAYDDDDLPSDDEISSALMTEVLDQTNTQQSLLGHHQATGEVETTTTDFMSICNNNTLREELRVNILQRRFQKGLGAVQLDWRLAKTENLTPEEEDKRRLRRERNRVAASRCREKRRERTYVLVKETDHLECSNQELIKEIEALENEKQELVSILSAHQQSCCSSPPVVTPTIEDLHIDPEETSENHRMVGEDSVSL